MAKVKKTFRIEEDAYDELVELSAGWGVAQGVAIERAIRLARQMPDTLPDTLPDVCQTGDSSIGGVDSTAVSALVGQLAVKDAQLAKKDEQIAKLMETVADSTKAVQGAQALHHETAQTLALESTEQKQSRWQRLKRAWMGI